MGKAVLNEEERRWAGAVQKSERDPDAEICSEGNLFQKCFLDYLYFRNRIAYEREKGNSTRYRVGDKIFYVRGIERDETWSFNKNSEIKDPEYDFMILLYFEKKDCDLYEAGAYILTKAEAVLAVANTTSISKTKIEKKVKIKNPNVLNKYQMSVSDPELADEIKRLSGASSIV